MSRSFIIAVDGPAASGKGTIAKRLAAHYGFAHLDTGSLYRKTAALVLKAGARPDNEEAAVAAAHHAVDAQVPEDVLRSEATGGAASEVAAIPAVRAALLEAQRSFAERPPGGEPGAVLDGRDVGTVVCPEAQVKLFVVATAEERARRRCAEAESRGQPADYAAILDEIRIRDERDTQRAHAPLKPAEDAVLLDTTELSIEAAFEAACAIVDRARTSA